MTYVEAATATVAGGKEVGQIEGVDLASAPAPRFEAIEQQFAPDLLFLGEFFASSDLIEALALDGRAVQILPVDCSACPPAMRAKEYKLLNFLAYANPLDRNRTWPALYTEINRSNGDNTFIWSREPWAPGMPAPRLFWRENLSPPAPLFRVPGENWVLATDELADRVLSAGFQDVIFQDMTNDGSRTHGLIVRTLDGTRTIE